MNKNDIAELEITGITNEGNGIGRLGGMVVFVPFSAVGDKLKVKLLKVSKTHAYAKIEEILSPSPDRRTPDCPVFGKCGGCSLRHLNYEAELKAKSGFIRDAFERIGGLSPEFLDIIPNPNRDGYRNKAQYPVGRDREGRLVSGFFADRSHRIVPCEKCMLEPPVFSGIRGAVLGLCEQYGISPYNEAKHSGVLRHICIRRGHYSGEINVVLAARRSVPQLTKLAERLCGRFPEIKGVVLNINRERTNVIYGAEDKTLCGEPDITDTMLGRSFIISPKSFYQVNTPMAERLYTEAAALAEPEGKNVIDLYCGIGTIGLTMADKAKRLIGADIVPSSIENARANALLNGAGNAEYFLGSAAEVTTLLRSKNIKADVVIIDPARKGSDPETLDNITAFEPERIVMISCDPATAARDCAYLEGKGYGTLSVRGVDLFSGTQHVETVILLSRK